MVDKVNIAAAAASSPGRLALQRMQALVRNHVPAGRSLSQELIRERRAASATAIKNKSKRPKLA